MQDIVSILDAFRRQPAPLSKRKGHPTHIFFLIDFDEDGRGFLEVTDSSGKHLDVDSRSYSGSIAQVLRTVDSTLDGKLNDIRWDSSTSRVFFDECPQLPYLLLECDNLMLRDSSAVTGGTGKRRVVLKAASEGGKTNAGLVLRPVGCYGADDDIAAFRLIDDSFAISGGVLFPVEPVGVNYNKLGMFDTVVDDWQAEMLLSLFLSNFTNVGIDFSGKETVTGASAITTIPTIVIDKVDSDNALYFHLAESVDRMDTEFTSDFLPSRIVRFSPDGRLEVRDVEYAGTVAIAESVKKRITASAPSKRAGKEVYEDDGFFIIPSHTVETFLLSGLAELVKDFRIIGLEKLSKYKVRPVTPSLKFTSGSGIDFLEGDAALEVAGEKFSFKEFLDQYSKNRYIQLSDGDKAIVEESYVKRLERLVSKEKGGGKLKVSFFDLPEVEKLLAEVPDCKAFRRSREFYSGFNSLQGVRLMKSRFKAQLRPYQEDGLKWIKYLYDNGMGGCLADDMGLGKTVQTIAMLTTVYPAAKDPTLIVMPRSLIFNWESELRKFAPQLEVCTYYGVDRSIEKVTGSQIVLTTYAIVRNDIEVLKESHFHYVILDESQNIKSLSAQITKSVFLLQSDHKLALSGTPVENNLSELYSLFRFLNPTMFGSEDDFNRRYFTPIHRDDDREALEELRRKIFPFMLRRLKKDVLKDLPERTDQALFVDMEPDQARFYEQRRKKYYEQVHESIASDGLAKSQFVMFQALSELRRIASVPESLSDGTVKSSKIPVLIENITDAVYNGHKTVVFFNFIAGMELVGAELEQNGIDFVVMSGSTRDREGVIDRFQNNPDCKVILMTLKTGGVGLNLTAADTVFIAEPWWNKAAEEQAINRLHRIGQKSNVMSYSIITRGTIEEKIRLLQEKKSSIIDNLIGSDGAGGKVLSEADIEFILG